MTEPFLGEIRIVGFNFAPRGWAFCDGQILPINQNPALCSVLGAADGSDGETMFAIPDLRGRAPVHDGTGPGLSPRSLGEKGGAATHTLTVAQLPNHDHALNATNNDATTDDPTARVMARAVSQVYGGVAIPGAMGAGTVANTGAGQAHENRQPYLGLYFCIALTGVFPSSD